LSFGFLYKDGMATKKNEEDGFQWNCLTNWKCKVYECKLQETKLPRIK